MPALGTQPDATNACALVGYWTHSRHVTILCASIRPGCVPEKPGQMRHSPVIELPCGWPPGECYFAIVTPNGPVE